MSDKNDLPPMPDWVNETCSTLGLTESNAPNEILHRAGDVADRLAPDTRRMWTWILAFQGAAVLIPLFWLLVVRERWEVSYTAFAVTSCTLFMIGICWWLRWRGMQHSWIRTRLITEIARSAEITHGTSPEATIQALNNSPSLQPIAQWTLAGTHSQNLPIEEQKQKYLTGRIEDQLAYYRGKRSDATRERKQLSKVVTISLDAALFMAVAGLAIALRPESTRWLQYSNSDYMLGFVGAALPLVAILAQLRGFYFDIDRRVGRYAQQIEYLSRAKELVTEASSEDELHEHITETERCLLGEVVEWFYKAEHSEPYYRAQTQESKQDNARELAIGAEPTLFKRIVRGMSISAGFVGRVIIGRVLVVALSVVVTTALIHYKRAPEDPRIHSSLSQDDGRLLSPVDSSPYKAWEPTPEATQVGFVLIAHGLHDGVEMEATGEHWMTQMHLALHANGQAAKRQSPDICLVDWNHAAVPSSHPSGSLDSLGLDLIGMPEEAASMLADISMIRSRGEQIGELVGFKIARAIRNGTLKRDQPMHFIGHSAGGFVVLNAARVLIDLGLAPDDLRITMLDTPLPVKEHLAEVAKSYPVDFYCTSAFAKGVPENGFDGLKFSRFDISPPAGTDPYKAAHSYAWRWFIDSIGASNIKEGFSRSSFATSTNN
ncbi:hypothetical protein [Rubritalea tangerina]|uniref:Uncharacterized protein n=1 Tax=Rubritalea tangerina TaxID=430798 RepID=A0ABW4Z5U9_9BACT